ncbi:MAG TPA: hypothetical protein VL992_11690 [Tepidisphaeraceae bacterium]|nr:hypothetical protein [Tepidisphaeraceae bacterium]
MTKAALRKSRQELDVEAESRTSELAIMPDGRVFAFGTSLAVLEILKSLEPENVQIGALLNEARSQKKGASEG